MKFPAARREAGRRSSRWTAAAESGRDYGEAGSRPSGRGASTGAWRLLASTGWLGERGRTQKLSVDRRC